MHCAALASFQAGLRSTGLVFLFCSGLWLGARLPLRASPRAEQLQQIRELAAREERGEARAALYRAVWGDPRMESIPDRAADAAAIELLPFWLEIANHYQQCERPVHAAAALHHVLPRVPLAQLPSAAASLAQLHLAMAQPARAVAVCGEVRARLLAHLPGREAPVPLPQPLCLTESAALDAALRSGEKPSVLAYLLRAGLPRGLPWPIPGRLAAQVPELCGFLALAHIDEPESAAAAGRWLEFLVQEHPEHPARQLWSGWLSWDRIARATGAEGTDDALRALEDAIAAASAPPAPWLIAAGRAALAAGDAGRGADLLDRAAALLRVAGAPDPQLSGEAAAAWERAGQPRRAALHLAELRACPSVTVLARARAALALARLDTDRALELHQEAVADALAGCADPAGLPLVILALDQLVAVARERSATEAVRRWLREQRPPAELAELAIGRDAELYLRWIDLALADRVEAAGRARELWCEIDAGSSCALPLARFLTECGLAPAETGERAALLALARALEQADDEVAMRLARELAAPLLAAGSAAPAWHETIAWLAVHLEEAEALDAALAGWDAHDPARRTLAAFAPCPRGQPLEAVASLQDRDGEPMAAWLLARARRSAGLNEECVAGCRALLASAAGSRWKAHAVIEAAQAMWADGRRQQAVANLEKALLLFPHEKEAGARARHLLARYGARASAAALDGAAAGGRGLEAAAAASAAPGAVADASSRPGPGH